MAASSETPRVALVGLPNAGKSTLFQALTRKEAEQGIYPFTTIHPSFAPFPLADPIFEQLKRALFKEKQPAAPSAKPAALLLYDIPGLIEGAAQGAGLGNAFLAEIRPAHFLLFVLRHFKKSEVAALGESPEKELQLLRAELFLSDLELLERAIQKKEKRAVAEPNERTALEKLHLAREAVQKGTPPAEPLEDLPLLSTKPWAILLNGLELPSEPLTQALASCSDAPHSIFSLDAELLLQLAGLPPSERSEFEESAAYQKVIQALQEKILETLHATLFYTVTKGTLESHLISQEATLFEAAGAIHTDIQKGFIKALALPPHLFLELLPPPKDSPAQRVRLGFEAARKEGKLTLLGKDDPVPPQSILHFEFRRS